MVDLDLLEHLLVGAARERRALTYGQILGFFERRVTRVTVGALCRDLGSVCGRIEAKGGPDLACLVVRKSDGLPGEGYFTAVRRDGFYDGPSSGGEAVSWVRQRQGQAFAHYGTVATGRDETGTGSMHETPSPLSIAGNRDTMSG